jgi:outer membrane protein assembly factor BamD (BamD/ComL family)
MKNYDTHNFMQERYARVNRGPEELFKFAQGSDDPRARIEAFQEIVDKYPDDEHAPEAMFMIGFVYAEEIHSWPDADRAFTRLIAKYPDSDMAKTARWMIDNRDQPMPKFQDLDDLNRQIDEKKNSD